MTVLFRLTMMLVGYIWACVVASLVLTLGTLTSHWGDLDALANWLGAPSGDVPAAALWSVVGIGALVIFAGGFIPTLLVIILVEGFALRSIVVYGVIGAALALAAAYGLDFGGYTAPDVDLMHEREVFAAAGIAGGLVYWLFAGRRAGVWK
jgi:hypothetical protein